MAFILLGKTSILCLHTKLAFKIKDIYPMVYCRAAVQAPLHLQPILAQ